MGYRVDYGPVGIAYCGNAHWFRRMVLTVCCFFLFLLLVEVFWPEGMDILCGILIPGEPEETLQALETFARELGAGEQMSVAFENFCLSILEGEFLAPG